MLTPLDHGCGGDPARDRGWTPDHGGRKVQALRPDRPTGDRGAAAVLRRRFDRALSDFLRQRSGDLEAVDLAPTFDLIRRFVLSDGKRLRPAFCYWGARSGPAFADPAAEDALIRAAASLELFHSFALI